MVFLEARSTVFLPDGHNCIRKGVCYISCATEGNEGAVFD